MKVIIEVSARHIHLTKDDFELLFGNNHVLNILKELSQPGQFAAKETVDLVGPKGKLAKVRVLGPYREQTQIEISETDAKILGVNPPVRDSGNLANTPGITVIGPAGQINLKHGVILAWRHLHIDPLTARKINFREGKIIKVDVSGSRDLLFENVLVRINKNYKLSMHIDTDEANAAGIDEKNNIGEIIIN